VSFGVVEALKPVILPFVRLVYISREKKPMTLEQMEPNENLISAEEAAKILRNVDLSEYKRLINQAIRKADDINRIRVPLQNYPTPNEMAAIKELARKAGWFLSLNTDQHNEPHQWFEITPLGNKMLQEHYGK
jgi:hypothetical protein